ncbi:MAG: hypothetical protein DMF09_13075 [Verrucomicrobia bacterium]|nr:MAG: hypothetical protein DMF09_13075 [Verrucomicrobiota bacterium]
MRTRNLKKQLSGEKKKKGRTMNSLIQLKTTTVLVIPMVLACLAFLPRAQAVSPPPDGGYSGFNTAEGVNALLSLGSGTFNTALGFSSLKADTTGSHNTAVGGQAVSNTTGSFNMALWQGALASNIGGNGNTAMGFQALHGNTASGNVAVGYQALNEDALGTRNTANGYQALASNQGGVDNTATGFRALFSNTEDLFNLRGHRNTATGSQALFSNRIGRNNTAVGYRALYNNTDGGQNIALGFNAGSNITGDLNIDIGNAGVALEQSTIRIGTLGVQSRAFIAGIRGVTTGFANAVNVVIDSAGQLGTLSSSKRFKKEIKSMDQTSEAILALKPVTFHYKSDSSNTPQFGLIAEEVAKVNPDLVVRDENGEVYTVRYDAVNAMLLNEFLKEHRKVEEQQSKIQKQQGTISELKATVAQQQKGMEVLAAQLKEQAAQIQKVSAELETSKPAAQVVNNR